MKDLVLFIYVIIAVIFILVIIVLFKALLDGDQERDNLITLIEALKLQLKDAQEQIEGFNNKRKPNDIRAKYGLEPLDTKEDYTHVRDAK